MRDSYENGKTVGTTAVKPAGAYTTPYARQALPATSNIYTTSNPQVVRGPATVRQSNLAPGYTTGSFVRPSTTTTINNGRRLPNGQWTSTVYAPETYQVGTYDSHIDQTIGVGRRRRNSYVIEVKEGGPTFIEERYVGERIVNVYENRLEDRIVHSQIPNIQTKVREVETWEDEPIVQERVVEKPVEVLVEKRIPVEKYVDVQYDVYVERPIEKIIEKEIEIEKVMERQIQKIVEVPIERIVEIPIERIIEQPIEIEKRVQVPYERVVERRVEDLIENIVYQDKYLDINSHDLHKYPHAQVLPTEVVIHEQDKIVERPVYYDNIIERIVDIPIEKIIERPIERIVEKPVEHIVEHSVYYDNIIEKTVQIPVEHLIEKPVERLVERPIYVDNIIERPVAIEVIKEQIKEIPVEHLIEKPVYIENIIHKPVEVLIENPIPVEKIIQVPIANYVDIAVPLDEVKARRTEFHVQSKPQAKVINRKLPIEYIVRKDNPVPVESTIEVNVARVKKDVYERVIERPVEVLRIIEKAIPVEKIVEVEVERVTENAQYTEKVTQKKVPFDQVIEQKYEVIVQNIIEVPVEKEIHVPVKTITRAPVENRNYFEKDVHVNSIVWEPKETGKEVELQSIEVNDEVLAQKTQQNKAQINQILSETRSLQVQSKGILEANPTAFTNKLNSYSVGNAKLRSELSELESRLNIVEKDKDRLLRVSRNNVAQVVEHTVADPKVAVLSRELEALIRENGSLVSQVKNTGKPTEVLTTIVESQPIVYEQVPVQYVEQPVIRRSVNIIDDPVYTTTTTTAAPVYTSNVIRTSGLRPSHAVRAAPVTYTTQAPVTYTSQAPVTYTTQAPVTYATSTLPVTYATSTLPVTYATSTLPVGYSGDYYRPSTTYARAPVTYTTEPVTTTTNGYTTIL
jgi:hypothetical protein